ncbi:tetratricopeptide repeat domain containing protein [Colletotrichum camelliae]|nr:tetratricopeptide repeat domain containing protein [Colletotrichum camelliae]
MEVEGRQWSEYEQPMWPKGGESDGLQSERSYFSSTGLPEHVDNPASHGAEHFSSVFPMTANGMAQAPRSRVTTPVMHCFGGINMFEAGVNLGPQTPTAQYFWEQDVDGVFAASHHINASNAFQSPVYVPLQHYESAPSEKQTLRPHTNTSMRLEGCDAHVQFQGFGQSHSTAHYYSADMPPNGAHSYRSPPESETSSQSSQGSPPQSFTYPSYGDSSLGEASKSPLLEQELPRDTQSTTPVDPELGWPSSYLASKTAYQPRLKAHRPTSVDAQLMPPPSAVPAKRHLVDLEAEEGLCKPPCRGGPLTQKKRLDAASTRKLGACIRCRMQHLTCEPNPEHPEGPCLTCSKLNRKSPKVVHKNLCCRAKMGEIQLSLPCNLGITERKFQSLAEHDLTDDEWMSNKVETVQLMTRGLCRHPLNIRVRLFSQERYDRLNYSIRTRSGDKEHMHLPPYALANVRDTRRSFQAYLDENFITSLKEQIDKEGTHPIIREHYLEALMHYDKLCDDFDEDNKERQVLKDFFKLRMALHHCMSPSWVYDESTGSHKCLGVYRVKDEKHPLLHRIPTPRMIVAQLYAIVSTKFVDTLTEKVLHNLEQLYSRAKFQPFFTVYVVTLLLLHEVSLIIGHWKDGREVFSGIIKEPMLPQMTDPFVTKMCHNAEILLLHWHYYRRKPNASVAGDNFYGDDMNKGFLSDVSGSQKFLVKKTWIDLKQKFTNEPFDENDFQGSGGLEVDFHPFYWASQMFVENWVPFQRISARRKGMSTTSPWIPRTPPEVPSLEEDRRT